MQFYDAKEDNTSPIAGYNTATGFMWVDKAKAIAYPTLLEHCVVRIMFLRKLCQDRWLEGSSGIPRTVSVAHTLVHALLGVEPVSDKAKVCA